MGSSCLKYSVLPISVSLFPSLHLESFQPYFLIIHFWSPFLSLLDFPNSSDCKESACNVGDLGSVPGLGKSCGEGNGNPFQYPCLENPMDRGAWQTTVHGVSRVRHNTATKPPPHSTYLLFRKYKDNLFTGDGEIIKTSKLIKYT